MSGLINSAGSKSGVIGITELNYEEGEWTPVVANLNDAVITIYDADYRVFGDLVIAHFAILINSTSDASAINLSFPFTCNVLSGSGSYQGGFLTYNNSGQDIAPVISAGASTAHFFTSSGGYGSYVGHSTDVLSGTVIYIRA